MYAENMTNQEEKKSSLLNYVGNFIEKHENQLREDEDSSSSAYVFDKDSLIIKTGERDFQNRSSESRTSDSTDIDFDDFSLISDPIIETREGGEQTYKQQVYLRQYQPPTPDPLDIQVQEILLKPSVQRPPIHVHIKPKKNPDEQRTPSPIFIKSAPPEPSLSFTNEPIFYNKYIPVDYKPTPRQIVIHRYPELPPKPRPIVIEQWLPNKPPPKRVTYHHVNREEFISIETKRKHNRYIEYKKPHTIIEIEIIRLPILKIHPQEYLNQSNELIRLDNLRSLVQNPDILRWRI